MQKKRTGFTILEIVVMIVTVAIGLSSSVAKAHAEEVAGNNYRETPENLPLKGLAGQLTTGDALTYTHPGGEAYRHGSDVIHKGSINGRNYAGISFELTLHNDRTFHGTLTTRMPENRRGGIFDPERHYEKNTASFSVAGEGTHRVFVRWSDFDRSTDLYTWRRYIKTVSLTGTFEQKNGGSVTVSEAKMTTGEVVALSCFPRGTAVNAGKTATYEVTVRNLHDEPVAISASLERGGWQEMEPAVAPGNTTLPPNASTTVQVKATVTEKIPEGAFETQTLRVVPDGASGAAETIEFYTSRSLPAPNLLHQREGWEKVRHKTEEYEWAAKKRKKIVAQARRWNVPESNFSGDESPLVKPGKQRPFVFTNKTSDYVFNCALAWQLTREKALAEKVATYLRRLVDPETGYPATQKATDGGGVQEGGYMIRIAKAYDLIKDAGVLGEEFERKLHRTARIYRRVFWDSMGGGGVSNQGVAVYAGGLYLALTLDDMAMANYWINQPGGLMDQFAAGFMSDGWWYEGAINYGIWVVNMFTGTATALDRRGISWLDKGFPLHFSEHASIRAQDIREDLSSYAGINYQKWGPNKHATLTIEEIYDSMLPFLDYRGIAFGTNDGHSKRVAAESFEQAYYVLRSEQFLPILNRLDPGDRSLVWGVPELPELPDRQEAPYEKSTTAPNFGYHLLRSQNDRPLKNRIQAALKFGTHGGHHGHYDRGALTCLWRNAKSMGQPKQPWFSYGPLFYKNVCQASLTHNMVLVDQKLQFPVDSDPLLFHSGEHFQAGAMETDAPWSFMPPRNQDPLKNGKPLNSTRYMPEFPDAPDNYNQLTGFTEDIRQRRLLIVTDDYVVLADAMDGKKEHHYDHTLWVRGLREMDAPSMEHDRHSPRLDPDPRKPAVTVTNVDWYDVEGTLRADYQYEVTDNYPYSNANDPGEAKYSVFHAWPKENRQIATCEFPKGNQTYQLECHLENEAGETIDEDEVTVWRIGTGEVDGDVSGESTMTLSVTNNGSGGGPALFWSGYVITADGERVPLSDIPYKAENMVESAPMTTDYKGGRITHAGKAVDRAVPAEPAETNAPSRATFDLENIDAGRVEASVACDYPVGEDPERRRGLIARVTGESARFLSVIEPYQGESVIERVTAEDAETLAVELTDDRTHEFRIKGLSSSAGDVRVSMKVKRDGETITTETTDE